MHSSGIKYMVFGALAAGSTFASPVQSTTRDLQVIEVTAPPMSERRDSFNRQAERGLDVFEIPSTSVVADDEKRDLLARAYPYNTDHCGVNGGVWMPLTAVDRAESGFNDACASFCGHYDGTIIPGGGSVSALVQSTGSEVLRLTDGSIGHFQGTIYCRKGHMCTIASGTCKEYMNAIGAPGSQCYGSKNKDTKGGRNDMKDSYYDAIPLPGAQT